MKESEKRRLLEEFPAHTYEEWKEAAVQLLKGRPFEKTLVTPTYEGFSLEPIYTRETAGELSHLRDAPGRGSRVRGSRAEGYLQGGWLVSQELYAPTPSQLNKVLLKELEGGQSELNLWLDLPTRRGVDVDSGEAGEAGICGLSLNSVDDCKALLEGVHPEMVSLYLRSGAAGPALYALLVAALREKGVELSGIRGCLGLDPIGWLVESGNLPGELERLQDATAALVRHAALVMPAFQILDVQGHSYHNGGGSSVQEMAAMLATGVAYLSALVERGIAAEQAAPRMRLSVTIGGNYFIEVAKLRALRMLWARVLEAFGVPEEARRMHLHARTGLWNKTLFDPYVNMLRTTTEAFSAVVGGCDSLHVGPFDEIIRESDAFSRRIARNTHTILAEECGLANVIDPAGGSWTVEALTDRMASEAWKQFQDIQAEGGILAVLQSGKLQEQIENIRSEKARNIQRRKDVIVGTNTYPNATETVLPARSLDYAGARSERLASVEQWKAGRDAEAVEKAISALREATGERKIEALVGAAGEGATLGELTAALDLGEPGFAVKPIRLQRSAADFEKLRFATQALKETGKPTQIHQLNMGPSRGYRIRADWTSSFFQVAGLEVLGDEDYAGQEDALAALKASGARVAVITSDDETYGTVVESLARAVKEMDPGVTVLLAGAPGDREAAWKSAGVDDFVHVRVNNYTFNRALLVSLGAAL